MTINEHLGEFGGFTVVDYRPGGGLPSPERHAWRLRSEWEGPPLAEGVLPAFLAEPEVSRTRGLVIGMYTDDVYDVSTQVVIDRLVAEASKLPSLEALFLGDMTFEECEISWIHHGDVTQLAEAFPGLVAYGVRGGSEQITVRPFTSANLRRLVFEMGGMPRDVLKAVCASDLPALEHLELWLGTSQYGGDVTVADLAPLLSGELFPSLSHLGLRDAEIADDVAAALADAPVVRRLKTLDLSLGTLSDAGARALLGGQSLGHLAYLDLHHHYLSQAMVAEIEATGMLVDLSDRQEPDNGDRYVAVGE